MSSYTFRAGEPGRNYAIWDKDGSIVGRSGGYVVGTDPFLKPKPPSKCRPMPNSNALACPATCYRTLYVSYQEPGFSPLANGTRKLGTFRLVLLDVLPSGVLVRCALLCHDSRARGFLSCEGVPPLRGDSWILLLPARGRETSGSGG